jgi:hypothetical protein
MHKAYNCNNRVSKEGEAVELSWSYGRRSSDEFVLVSGSPLGPLTRFYPYPFFSDNCFLVLPVGRPLWWEDWSVTYSAIADWSGHWGPITIHYCLIWDCVPSSSPLMTHRDYSGGILIHLHTWYPEDHGSPPGFMFSLPLYLNNEFVIRLQEQRCLFLLQDGRRDRYWQGSVIWFLAEHLITVRQVNIW